MKRQNFYCFVRFHRDRKANYFQKNVSGQYKVGWLRRWTLDTLFGIFNIWWEEVFPFLNFLAGEHFHNWRYTWKQSDRSIYQHTGLMLISDKLNKVISTSDKGIFITNHHNVFIGLVLAKKKFSHPESVLRLNWSLK